MTGIYKITNKTNQHSYVGQAIDIDKRLREHINDAFNSKRKAFNYPLSKAYRKYGICEFDTEILEECPQEELNDKEVYYISYFNTYKDGYNQTPGGTQHSMSGEKHCRAKITDAELFTIREQYNHHTPKNRVYEQYQDRISLSGFTKLWLGYSRTTIHMDVYTQDNKQYWEYVKNISGNRLYSDEEILDIRIRLKNGESSDSIYQDYLGKTSHNRESFNYICDGSRYRHIKV